MKKKTLILVLSLTLILGIIAGGTFAWLKASSDQVVNTFTVGDINIELKEHPLKTGDAYDGKSIDTSATPVIKVDNYKMMPGRTLQKDPYVIVKANSEACWLFVKIEKSANFDTYMEFEVDSNWIALEGQDGVYYRQVEATTADTAKMYVLKDNVVTVKSTVTKAQLEAAQTTNPTLKLTAYAIQLEGFENNPSGAWTAVNQ